MASEKSPQKIVYERRPVENSDNSMERQRQAINAMAAARPEKMEAVLMDCSSSPNAVLA